MAEDAATERVTIPTTLFKKIENLIKGTSFSSVSSYVTYVVQQAISETEKVTAGQSFSKEDEEAVKKRLRALGYIE